MTTVKEVDVGKGGDLIARAGPEIYLNPLMRAWIEHVIKRCTPSQFDRHVELKLGWDGDLARRLRAGATLALDHPDIWQFLGQSKSRPMDFQFKFGGGELFFELSSEDIFCFGSEQVKYGWPVLMRDWFYCRGGGERTSSLDGHNSDQFKEWICPTMGLFVPEFPSGWEEACAPLDIWDVNQPGEIQSHEYQIVANDPGTTNVVAAFSARGLRSQIRKIVSKSVRIAFAVRTAMELDRNGPPRIYRFGQLTRWEECRKDGFMVERLRIALRRDLSPTFFRGQRPGEGVLYERLWWPSETATSGPPTLSVTHWFALTDEPSDRHRLKNFYRETASLGAAPPQVNYRYSKPNRGYRPGSRKDYVVQKLISPAHDQAVDIAEQLACCHGNKLPTLQTLLDPATLFAETPLIDRLLCKAGNSH